LVQTFLKLNNSDKSTYQVMVELFLVSLWRSLWWLANFVSFQLEKNAASNFSICVSHELSIDNIIIFSMYL
jgi:hypothetical protein